MNDPRAPFASHCSRVGEDEPPETGFRATFLNVGGGQCVIVEDGDSTLVYDGGPTEQTGKKPGPYDGNGVLEALDKLGIEWVNHVIVSHLDTDHFAQLTDVVETFGNEGVGTVHIPDTSTFQVGQNQYDRAFLGTVSEAGVSLNQLSEGDRLPVGELDVQVLNPPEAPKGTGNRDQRSAVLSVLSNHADRRLLLTGDVYGDPERRIADRYGSILADVDAFDIPKHGSKSVTDDLIRSVTQAVGILSHHRNGSYGYPHPETVETLAQSPPGELLSTAVHGCVTVTMDEQTVEVEHATGEDIARTVGSIVSAQDQEASLTDRIAQQCELGSTDNRDGGRTR